MEAQIVNPAPLTKETASDFPATSNETSPTLEETLDKIRDLYRQEQAAKWGQGEQVNLVEDTHLALKKGYKQARECLKRELPDLQTSMLYTYAFVAKHFSQEHTKRYGVSKLQKVIALHNQGGGVGLVGDPADLEVHVPRGDGSLVAKKFSDCTLRELQSATKHRKQTRKAGQAVREGPSGTEHAPKLPSPGLWRPLAMLSLGVLAGFIADLLLPSVPGLVISFLAILLTLSGVAELIRYFASIRDRIIAAFKSGAGLSTIKEHSLEVLRNGRKLLAALRSARAKPTPTTTREENPPPPEKKAA